MLIVPNEILMKLRLRRRLSSLCKHYHARVKANYNLRVLPLALALLWCGCSHADKGQTPSSPGQKRQETATAYEKWESVSARYRNQTYFPFPVVMDEHLKHVSALSGNDKDGNPRVAVSKDFVARSQPPLIDFVVSHETGHLVLRHSYLVSGKFIRATDSEYNADLFAQAVFIASGRESDLPEIYREISKLRGNSTTHPSGPERVRSLKARRRFPDNAGKQPPHWNIGLVNSEYPVFQQPETINVMVKVFNADSRKRSAALRVSASINVGGRWKAYDTAYQTIALDGRKSSNVKLSLLWSQNWVQSLGSSRPLWFSAMHLAKSNHRLQNGLLSSNAFLLIPVAPTLDADRTLGTKLPCILCKSCVTPMNQDPLGCPYPDYPKCNS